MDVRVIGRKMEVTDALKDYTVSKVTKVQKLISKPASSTVTLSVQKLTHKVDIAVNIDGHIFQAVEENAQMYEAIDKAVLKLETQLKKFKGKVKDHRTPGIAEAAVMIEEEAPEAAEEQKETAKLELKHLTREEAIREVLNTSGNFLMFMEIPSNKVRLAHKNEKNEVNIVDPSL